jgi:putative phage-type endonuclease
MTSISKANKPAANRPALKLVKTNNLSREDWLNVRKHGIGSSDAAAAVGLNPYQSQLELWMVKTGRDTALPKVNPNDETSPMYWGTLLEPIVAAHYTKRTGNRVRRINAVLQHPDPDKSWMLANIDREIVGANDVQILECKTCGGFSERLWSEENPPEYVQLQVQHQLAVTGKSAADVCVLVCGQEIRVYRIPRDDALIAKLIELERQFWNYVETDTPPPADGSESAELALRCLYPDDFGTTLDLTDDREMSATFADLVNLRADIANRQELESLLKQRIQERMGENSYATFETGSISYKRSKDGLGIDIPNLLLAQPDLVKRYPLVKSGSRRFLIKS